MSNYQKVGSWSNYYEDLKCPFGSIMRTKCFRKCLFSEFHSLIPKKQQKLARTRLDQRCRIMFTSTGTTTAHVRNRFTQATITVTPRPPSVQTWGGRFKGLEWRYYRHHSYNLILHSVLCQQFCVRAAMRMRHRTPGAEKITSIFILWKIPLRYIHSSTQVLGRPEIVLDIVDSNTSKPELYTSNHVIYTSKPY